MSKNTDLNGINAYVSSKNIDYNKSLKQANDLLNFVSNENLSKGKVQDANFFVLRKSTCPAVLLEIGYLSNENDFHYITNKNGQKEIAKKIFDVISK